MYITELFDKQHPWSWAITEPNEYRARFASENDEAVEVLFLRHSGFMDEMWDLEFRRDAEEGITGQGDAFKIFATVAEIVRDFVRREDPEVIVFGAKEPSRVSLYNRMLPRLAKALNMKFERHHNQFILGR